MERPNCCLSSPHCRKIAEVLFFPKPPGFHTTAREPKRAHFTVPAFNTTRIQRRHPERHKKSEMVAGEGKKAKFPAEGGPAEGGVLRKWSTDVQTGFRVWVFGVWAFWVQKIWPKPETQKLAKVGLPQVGRSGLTLSVPVPCFPSDLTVTWFSEHAGSIMPLVPLINCNSASLTGSSHQFLGSGFIHQL